MSMYALYAKEYIGDEVIETEKGFVQYRYLNEKQVYIVNIWIRSDFRKSGEASHLADRIVEQAKLSGRSELIGSVVPQAIHSTDSLQVLLGYGMKLKSASDNLILFSKEI